MKFTKMRDALDRITYVAETETHRYVVRRSEDAGWRKWWVTEIWTLKPVGELDPVMISDRQVGSDLNPTLAEAKVEAEKRAAPAGEQPAEPEKVSSARASSSKAILRRAADGYGYTSRDGRWAVKPAYSPTHLGGSAARPSYWIIEDEKALVEQATRPSLADARELVGERMKRDVAERPAPVVLVTNGYGAGYVSTDGVWDVPATFGRRRRGIAPTRPAFFTVRHIPSDTELAGTYKNISAVRQAFAYGKISAPAAAEPVCRDDAGNPYTSHDFTPDGLGRQCRRCAAPREQQVEGGEPTLEDYATAARLVENLMPGRRVAGGAR